MREKKARNKYPDLSTRRLNEVESERARLIDHLAELRDDHLADLERIKTLEMEREKLGKILTQDWIERDADARSRERTSNIALLRCGREVSEFMEKYPPITAAPEGATE